MEKLYCEHTASGFDPSLRFACMAPATFGVYDKSTLDIEHYVCTKHVSDVPREWGTVILSGDVQSVKKN